ncbi:MAG TPA: Na/Pi symporter [Lentimicrobium sp.]|nr:Na/Pi symporter [Lentimicrobium sp.]
MHDIPGNQNIIFVILSVLGSLTIFLYGMKTMGEALQKLSGGLLSRTFSSLASNRSKGFFSGLLVTGTIQSSTAVTVMLVSLVNAGFFTLSQGMSLMIGANVGTTATAWLLSLLGFHKGLEVILIPLMAFSLPFLFRKNKKYRSISELITGFVLIFTGFYFLLESLPTQQASRFVSAVAELSGSSIGTNLLYTFTGILLASLIRSSSAASALTIVMCFDGWMSFENAIAMIIGENIGTTLTANLAARIATRASKRLAAAHTLFNIAGAVIFFVMFHFAVKMTDQFTTGIIGLSPLINVKATPVGLAIFHSGFNIVMALIALIAFIPFKKLTEVIIPVNENEDQKANLRYIDTGYLSMTDISLRQVQDEIKDFGIYITEMFALITDYLAEKKDDKFIKIQKKLTKMEERADAREVIISNYLTKLAANGLTETSSRKLSSMLKIIDEIESIGDQCMQLERVIRLKNEAKAWMTPEMREQILKMFSLVREALENMNTNLSKTYSPGILIRASELEIRINDARDNFIAVNRKNIENGQYSYQHGSYFADVANHCEKIGDHIININQAIATNIK